MIFAAAFVASFLISYLLTPVVIRVACRYGFITDKRKRYHPAHTHKGILPRAGGVSIFLAVSIGSFVFIPASRIIVAITLAAFILLIAGLWDDKKDVSPYLRFLINILAAFVAVMGGIGVPYISNPFGNPIDLTVYRFEIDFFGQHTFLWLSNLLSVLWIVFLINAVNWSKGVDGQLPGFVGISAFFMALLADRFSAFDINAVYTAIFGFLISGAFFGFLPFNFYPQKILPGYSTGSLAGFYLAVLSLLSFTKVGTLLIVLAIPLLDALYTIVRRIAAGKSPFRADWGHLHHKLLEIGWGRRRIAFFYWLVTAIFGITALFLKSSLQKIIVLAGVMIIFVYFIVFLRYISQSKDTAASED